jgi:Na+/H+ antiporter NhaD/arsenite permease-like protein
MNLAWISLVALLIAITLSMLTQVNVGVVSLAFAWIVGVYLGGMPLNTVIGTFPIQLFLTLIGVTLLFGMAGINGTLGRLASRAVAACRGNAGVIPIMFFLIALGLSSIGPGNIATTAILAPMAMAVGARAGISPFLMALMVGNGAQAGALSPFAPTGVIVNGIMDRIGLAGHEMQTYLNNLGAHVVVTFAAYFLFGGLQLFTRKAVAAPSLAQSDQAGSRAGTELVETEPFQWIHWLTLSVLILLVVVVVLFQMNVGMAALTGAALLSLAGAGNEKEAIKKMPWGVVIMVCGVTVLIGVLEKTQGMSLFADLLARISTPGTVTLTIAFVTGVVSVYSSTSGVVLPAFLPTVPALAQQLGGADPLAIASAMYVGGHLVDLSPLSTIGALCIAALPAEADSKKLFNQLLAWGLSMMVVGAVICWVLF